MTDCVLCGEAVESNRPDAIYCEYKCHAELISWVLGYGVADPQSVIRNGTRAGAGGWLTEEVTCCYLCGELPTDANPMNVEHVYPRDLGGSDVLPNVGMACRRCNSVKSTKVIELTDEQAGRLTAQQSAFATRYADMKAHLPAAVLQASSDCLWLANGFDDDEDGFENGDAYISDAVDAVVQAIYEMGELPPDEQVALCRTYGPDILQLYAERGWLSDPGNSLESEIQRLLQGEVRGE